MADQHGMPSVPSVDDMARAIAEMRDRIDSDDHLRHELVEGHTSGNPMTLGPRLPSPDEWAQLQVKGSQDNAQKWLQRTTNPRKNFKAEALKDTTAQRYRNAMEQALREDRWRGGMALVSEDETIKLIQKRGANVYAQGVADRADKIAKRVKELHADRLALAATLDQMPTSTDAEREAKVLANIRGLKAIGEKRRKTG